MSLTRTCNIGRILDSLRFELISLGLAALSNSNERKPSISLVKTYMQWQNIVIRVLEGLIWQPIYKMKVPASKGL